MDVVFPYKRSVGDLELRYSLRSLVNVPHGRVIIAGDVPSIVSDAVSTIKVPRVGGDRYLSSTANIMSALDEIDGDFIVMHDDIFVLKPWTFKHEDRGPIDQTDEAKGDYLRRIQQTDSLLRAIGITDPLFYGLHTPTVYNKRKLIDLVREFPMPRYKYLLRTLYWNIYRQPSVQRHDVKVKDWPIDHADDVLSISDGVARMASFQEWINRQFPVASKYEVIA